MNDLVLEKVGELLAEITEALDEPHSMVNNAVIVVDYMDVHGNRWLRIVRNRDVQPWMMRGMLHEVLADLDAFEVVYQLGDDR